MEKTFHIKDKSVLANCIGFIAALGFEPVYEVVIRELKEKRSQKQRRLQWMWYTEIAKSIHWEPKEVRNDLMRRYAVPIFYRDNINGSADSIDVIKDLKAQGLRRHYEEMVKCFVINITSNSFNVSQNHEYLEQIDRDAHNRGIQLTIPDEMSGVFTR